MARLLGCASERDERKEMACPPGERKEHPQHPLIVIHRRLAGVSSASAEGDRPTKSDRDPNTRDLEATVVAMRRALELAEREADDRLQAERARASAEAEQLKAMITELRQELEAQQERHAEVLQEQKQQASDEVRQLQATIRALRDELDASGR
jgi:chromatin segregation and condensation protein Rec8/ScpA/Scc1 (kleisin family)